jgi:hypothetical protein
VHQGAVRGRQTRYFPGPDFVQMPNYGANTTMISKDLTVGLTPLGEVPSNNQAEAGIGSVYGAVVQIGLHPVSLTPA